MWSSRFPALRSQAGHPFSVNGPAAKALSQLIPEGGDRVALLRQKFGERAAGELLALAREPDQEMLGEGLVVFGRRLEAAGRTQLAAEVYGAVAGIKAEDTLPHFQKIQQTASRQLAALEGKGSTFGLRAEVLGRNLFAGGIDYRLAGFMVLGAGLFQATKSLAWARLWARPVTGFWSGVLTRGAGAHLVSAAAGLAVQAPATSLLHRSWLAASGETVDWDLLSISREAAGMAIAQSVMSFSGWLGSKVSGAAFLQPAVSFFGMLGARSLEIGVGLRPQEQGGTLLADTFAEWIGLSVGARLGFSVLGSGWSRFRRDLALRGKQWEFARPVFAAFSQTAPGTAKPNMVFAQRWDIGTSIERLMRWVDVKPSRDDSPLRRYPKLRSSLTRAGITPEEGEELFNLVVQRAGEGGARAAQSLSAAVNAMGRLQFSFEQMRSLLGVVGKAGENYSLLIAQIPHATRAVRKLRESREAKHRFLANIGEKAGSRADLVYGNLAPAVRSMAEEGWALGIMQEMILGMLDRAEDQISTVLGNFDAAFVASHEENWLYRDKIRLYSLLAQPAEDSQTMAWRYRKGFPRAIDAMKTSGWESEDRFEVMLALLEATDIDTALINFPKAVRALDAQEWPSSLSVAFFPDVFRQAGRRAGHFLWCLPALSFALTQKGHLPRVQRDLLPNFAEGSQYMNVFDLVGLVEANKPKLNRKEN
jgi:hypothetical protein